MTVWMRSLAVLAAAFAGVMILTFGLAAAIVPGQVGAPSDAEGAARTAESAAPSVADLDAIPSGVGGTLKVTGDLEASLPVDRESTDGRYGLVGDDARIFFGGDPLSVVQMNLEGLSFFPELDACQLAPGRLNSAIGVASAHLRCAEVADIRGNGVVTVDAVIGIAGDMLGLRGDLPPSGGTVTVGDDVRTFSEARILAFGRPAVAGARGGSMATAADGTELHFDYDVHTHEISLAAIVLDGVTTEIPANGCSIATRELGRLNPRTAVLDLALACPAVELADRGTVAIDGTLVVEQVEAPF